VHDTLFVYNKTGSVTSVIDALGRTTRSISYTDSFSDAANRNTFAYPTTITDADNFSSTIQYNYDFGGVTRTEDPKNAVATVTYDGAARTDRITNQTNGAYVRYVYTSAGDVQTYSTIQNGFGEAYSVSYFDGAGRVRATAAENPGSSGGYSAQFTYYDVMGRVSQQTNPAEINAAGTPWGDDAAGWSSTLQTYDWKGRPLVTTNPDGTTRENQYGGCGCAGGEQTTVRDENGRRKRYTKDVLGRLVKVEELNWDQTVYATTNYTLNVRDQITSINQEGQTRTFGYDGYGRLATRTTPEQGSTTYSYFADDRTQTIADARGATTTFAYNARGFVTSIAYGFASGVAATPNVSFGYDAAGNRTSMTDGLGSMSYVYNTLSQLTSETRIFSDFPGSSHTLSYGYNLSGELNSITNQWGAQVGYGYDKLGRPTNVSGSGYVGLTSYVNSISYRAFGGLKQMAYNNGRTLSMQYDNRLRLTQWSIPSVLRMQYSYLWEQSGRLEFARNLDDETLDRWYGYDQVGRLAGSHSGNEARLAIGEQVPLLYNGPYSHGYQYDKWGNITDRDGWGGENPSFTATYVNNKRVGLTYDAAGNLTNDGGYNFTYDVTGQQATASSAGYLLEQYYDGDGLRGKKKENNAPTYYLRSSVLGGQVVAEINGAGAWQRGYIYLGGELVAVQQGGVYWVHQDPLAKSKRVTDASGTVVSTVELDPWGGSTNRSSNFYFQPHMYNSYERDTNGADDAMFRRYNRWWSRFDQPDPFGGSYDLTNPQSFNRYAYVQNDPVNLVDPFGLDPIGGLGGMISGALGGAVIGPSIGPGTTVVNVRDDAVFIATSFPVEILGPANLRPIGGQQKPLDPKEAEQLLTDDCLKFLDEILAEVGSSRPVYDRSFNKMFNDAKKRGVFHQVRLSDEVFKTRFGGTNTIMNDSSLRIEIDERLLGRSNLSGGYIMIHEMFHASAAAGYMLTHYEMAVAAYSVASARGLLTELAKTNGAGPPRIGTTEADDRYNALIFNNVVQLGCPKPK